MDSERRSDHSLVDSAWGVIVGGRDGDAGGGGGMEKGRYSFSQGVKQGIIHSFFFFFKLNPRRVCLFLGSVGGEQQKKKSFVCSIFTGSPCVFICRCVATEASGLYRCCVYPWSCCLFIIRPPYCEDAASVFKVSTTQSLSRYRNHSTC